MTLLAERSQPVSDYHAWDDNLPEVEQAQVQQTEPGDAGPAPVFGYPQLNPETPTQEIAHSKKNFLTKVGGALICLIKKRVSPDSQPSDSDAKTAALERRFSQPILRVDNSERVANREAFYYSELADLQTRQSNERRRRFIANRCAEWRQENGLPPLASGHSDSTTELKVVAEPKASATDPSDTLALPVLNFDKPATPQSVPETTNIDAWRYDFTTSQETTFPRLPKMEFEIHSKRQQAAAPLGQTALGPFQGRATPPQIRPELLQKFHNNLNPLAGLKTALRALADPSVYAKPANSTF